MPTLVLIGFSCAGKSHLGDQAARRWPQLEIKDTDAWISRNYIGGDGEAHIYNMFLNGRDAALGDIARSEAEFLDSQQRTDKSVLIAAGPGIVIREPAWRHFVNRVQPRFLYLVQTPEQAAAGLQKRREQQRTTALADHEAFGSWDEGTLTVHNGVRWVDDKPARIVENVRTHMSGLVEVYERCARAPENRLSKLDAPTPESDELALRRVGALLGLQEP